MPTTTATLPAWSQRLLDELQERDQRATTLARALTPDQLNWRASEGSWSIGQCLQHLAIANDVYIAAITSALENQSRSPVDEITPGWFGRWFIRNYIAPSEKKAKAPTKIVPAERVDAAILDRLLQGNEAVRHLIRRAAQLDVNRVRFRNPFVGLLRFTVGTGLEIISKHQLRHLLQAERVRQSPNFPAR